jgi:hypothetical protein
MPLPSTEQARRAESPRTTGTRKHRTAQSMTLFPRHSQTPFARSRSKALRKAAVCWIDSKLGSGRLDGDIPILAGDYCPPRRSADRYSELIHGSAPVRRVRPSDDREGAPREPRPRSLARPNGMTSSSRQRLARFDRWAMWLRVPWDQPPTIQGIGDRPVPRESPPARRKGFHLVDFSWRTGFWRPIAETFMTQIG